MVDPTKEALRRLVDLDFHRELSLQSRMRYVLKGMKSLSGEYIRLEATRIGSTWYSSQEAVERLIAAVNERPNQTFIKTPAQRAAQNEAAKRILEAHGV